MLQSLAIRYIHTYYLSLFLSIVLLLSVNQLVQWNSITLDSVVGSIRKKILFTKTDTNCYRSIA